MRVRILSATSLAAGLALFSGTAWSETITIGIGHQSTVTNTVPGGIIMEKLGLLEEYLPHDGKYADADYDIIYRDYTSGPPITNQMIAGKLQFGVMGDYPLIVNGATFQANGGDESLLIEITGYNLKGTGNGVVVPVASDAYSLEDLKGKSISAPFGSAAWGMLLSVLDREGMSDEVKLVNQSPPVGVNNIAVGRIDAHADFTPWSEVMEFRGTGRKVYDGSEADIPTFHGTVVLKSFAEEYPEIVDAYIKATLAAQDWIEEDPMNAAIKVSEWTGIEKEVLYLYFSEGGISTFEASLKPEWIESLKSSHALLMRERDVPPLDFGKWVDDSYVRAAMAEHGDDYDAMVASVVDTATANEGRPAEIWHPRDGISRYDSMDQFFQSLAAIRDSGFAPLASYVYDAKTGLKLFGKSAFYAESPEGAYAAFLKKSDAEAAAGAEGGKVVAYADILDGYASQ
ncbi:ABC transporter substrate-binding protein [Poseidonocella sp. HB161398]|uniref:ABC transporter substrate-binding protein n=1 Tax=Poseidonocella sp. HB161398 TaxID=2320855 RepID=UPI001108AAAE|nr:ABC transporter substrate-binding protein [Poseidonocella sp. HB161398]